MGIGAFVGRFLSRQPESSQVRAAVEEHDFPDWEVVGESHYQDHLWSIVGEKWMADRRVRVAKPAALIPEPENPYDRNAVAVYVNGLITGYLSREDAAQHQPRIVARQAQIGRSVELPALIAGGGLREGGPGQLGVFLKHDPVAFGEAAPVKRSDPPMRTGLSDALATDEEDDSYALSWLAPLPADPVRAIPALRALLNDERDVIDRHFMLSHLEDALYTSREAFTSALDEYDECCRTHDLEMEAIRAACMRKWLKVPWLDTYRQMCIRQAKAKRFDEALRWAERGLMVYGLDAARVEAVTDLMTRAAAYRARLAPAPKRAARPAAVVASPPQPELLTCVACGEGFERMPARGRKPTKCPKCRTGADA